MKFKLFGRKKDEELLTEKEETLEESAAEETTEEDITEEIETEELDLEREADLDDEDDLDDDDLNDEEDTGKKSKKFSVWQIILAALGSAVALCALALVLLYGLGFEIVPQAGDFKPSKVYTVSEKKFAKKADDVVATVGDKELTNAKLQLYYNMVVSDNYSYLSYYGFDYKKSMSQQECSVEKGISWEEFFLNMAIDFWVEYQSLNLLAAENGFVIPEETKEFLDSMIPELEAQAKEMKYESAEAMLKSKWNCSLEDFVDLWTMQQVYVDFLKVQPTMEELEKYFAENEEKLAASGITKDSGPRVSVRHILVTPEGGETDDQGNTTYTDKAWKAAKKEADAILKQWKKGEATEESFAKLADEKTDDAGSKGSGGLYEGITKDGSYVEEFLAWCMDENHKVGDVGIVKTKFGYHIMYLSATEPAWVYEATNGYINNYAMETIESAKAKWPAQINLKKARLLEINFG